MAFKTNGFKPVGKVSTGRTRHMKTLLHFAMNRNLKEW